ncbi:ankyrin repeat-containing domain protein [Schizophyllum commune]
MNLLLEDERNPVSAYVHGGAGDSDPCLHLAASTRRPNVIRLLLGKGASVDILNDRNEVALHHAAREGCHESAQLLLRAGAYPNTPGYHLRTPLHIAARCGRLEVIRLLDVHRAIIDLRDDLGWTPLFSAVWNGQKDAVELLIELGADVQARADDATTMLDAVGKDPSLSEDRDRDEQIYSALLQSGLMEETGKVPKYHSSEVVRSSDCADD